MYPSCAKNASCGLYLSLNFEVPASTMTCDGDRTEVFCKIPVLCNPTNGFKEIMEGVFPVEKLGLEAGITSSRPKIWIVHDVLHMYSNSELYRSAWRSKHQEIHFQQNDVSICSSNYKAWGALEGAI